MKKHGKASKYYRDKADRRISELYTGLPCVICGTTWQTCGHHIIPKSRSSLLRHDTRNLIALCPKHHLFSNDIAAHSINSIAVHAFVEFLKEKSPERYEFLIKNQHVSCKPDYEAACNRLKDVTRLQCSQL